MSTLNPNNEIKVAVAHDWLVGMRGGEQVLEAILELFPNSEVFTLICDESKISDKIKSHQIHTSFLQKIPGIFKHYQKFLPIMPLAAQSLDLSQFDLVVSSSHCVIKGVHRRKDAVHVSYVHAPMRYIWDRFEEYFGKSVASIPVRMMGKLIRGYLQKWDFRLSQKNQVDSLVGNSRFICEQIKNHYQRDSKVIHPFVKSEEFLGNFQETEDYYLVVSALVPYKRIDLAVKAFNELGLKLKVVGQGSELEKLKSLAKSNVEILGYQSRDEILKLYTSAKAFIFPGQEDFGITPLESMASGVPVIAYESGGALDTVSSKTGVFFKNQSIAELKQAVQKIELKEVSFDRNELRAHAFSFSRKKFQEGLLETIINAFEDKKQSTIQKVRQMATQGLQQSVSSPQVSSESAELPNVANDSNQSPQP